jgi:hypothetical protein
LNFHVKECRLAAGVVPENPKRGVMFGVEFLGGGG